MTLKTKGVFIAIGSIALALLCSALYFRSDRYAFSVALKRYRQKEYKATIAILDRLSPKNQRSLRGVYLRSSSQYSLALEACGQRRYEDGISLLASIPEGYQKYGDVKQLRAAIEQKQSELRQERERQEELAEAAGKERQRQEQEDAERKAEDRSLYGADLNARVNCSDGQVHITNLNTYEWVDVEFQINPGIFNKGYFLKASRIEAGEAYSVGIMQFADRKGERFNPFAMKPRTFTIVAHKPNGSVDVQSYEWN